MYFSVSVTENEKIVGLFFPCDSFQIKTSENSQSQDERVKIANSTNTKYLDISAK